MLSSLHRAYTSTHTYVLVAGYESGDLLRFRLRSICASPAEQYALQCISKLRILNVRKVVVICIVEALHCA